MLVAALATGAAIGLWTALLTDVSSCRGLCVIFLEHRFAAWQSVAFGVAGSVAVLAAELAFDGELRSLGLRFVRWLNHDVTPT
jgi:hypothetical protein